MFQSLRANNQVYIFYKDLSNPRLDVGVVLDVTAPRPGQMTSGFMPQMNYVVDMNVKIGDNTVFLQGLAANATTDKPKANPNIVVSMSREQISEEVKAFRQFSIDHINANALHENNINCCDKIYQQLNPEVMKQQQTEQEIQSMKQQMLTMSQGMAQIMEVNKQLLDKLNSINGTEKKVPNKTKGDN